MNKIEFKNLPDTSTPANADNLNAMQDNIEAEMQPLKENILSNNLFDGKLLADKVHGSTGVITSSGISTNENYIPVKEGKSIAISNNGKAMTCDIFFYNASYTYMSVVRSTSTTEVPTGASYVAFNVATADLTGNKIMVNYGTEPMEYEEYVNAIAELEAEIGTKISKIKANKNLEAVGWYRIAKYNNSGVTAKSFIANINTRYNAQENMSVTLFVNISYKKATITNVSSNIRYSVVNKIRVVQEDDVTYLEIYYRHSTRNLVLIEILSQGDVTILDFEAATDTATVLNEITIMQQNDITTGTEFKTGRMIDGKEEYAKRINIGTMPNATEKEVAHGLDMTKIVINDIRGVMQAGSGYAMSLPFLNSSNQNVYIDIRPTVIRVTSTQDRSAYTGHVTLYYTKN